MPPGHFANFDINHLLKKSSFLSNTNNISSSASKACLAMRMNFLPRQRTHNVLSLALSVCLSVNPSIDDGFVDSMNLLLFSQPSIPLALFAVKENVHSQCYEPTSSSSSLLLSFTKYSNKNDNYKNIYPFSHFKAIKHNNNDKTDRVSIVYIHSMEENMETSRQDFCFIHLLLLQLFKKPKGGHMKQHCQFVGLFA